MNFEISAIDFNSNNKKSANQDSYITGEFTVKLEVLIIGKGLVRIHWTKNEFNFGAKAEAYLKTYSDAKLFLTSKEKGLYGQFS